MTVQIEVTEEIGTHERIVWLRLASIEDTPRYLPSIVGIEMLTGGPVGTGTRWRETRRAGGSTATVELQITQFDPPRAMTIECNSMGCRYTTRISVEPQHDADPQRKRTIARMQMTAHPIAWYGGILSRLSSGMMRKGLASDLAGVRAAAESDGGA